MRVCSPENDCAGPVRLATLELDHFVFSDHDLFNRLAEAELVALALAIVECTQDVCTCHCTQPLHSVEVCVLDADDAPFGEQLFGLVLHQLPVNEHVRTLGEDAFDFLAHLLLLSLFDKSEGNEGVCLHLGALNLDLVSIHGRVGHQHLAVLLLFRAAD